MYMCTYKAHTHTHIDFLLFKKFLHKNSWPLNLDPQLCEVFFRECIILFCLDFLPFILILTYLTLYVFFFIKLLEWQFLTIIKHLTIGQRLYPVLHVSCFNLIFKIIPHLKIKQLRLREVNNLLTVTQLETKPGFKPRGLDSRAQPLSLCLSPVPW